MNIDPVKKLSEQELLDLREKINQRLTELASRPAVLPGVSVELTALAVQGRSVRCRTMDGQHRFTLRPSRGLQRAVEVYYRGHNYS